MKKAILASNNKHKLEEIHAILKDFEYELVSMHDAGLVNFEIVEDGETFEENSLIKAQAVMDKLGVISIADDSGLMVDYINGAPGVYSARYAGPSCDYHDNNEKLLSELKDVPLEKRTARFVSVITILFRSGKKIVARGEAEGHIAFKYHGDNGFGYDPLFIDIKSGKSFAELSSKEKNTISHRGKALEILKEKLVNFSGE